MNQNNNDYQEFLSIMNNLSEEEKAILSEYLNAHKEEFYAKPVDTFGKACAYAMEKLVKDFLTSRESLIPDTEKDYAKSIYNQSQQERGKSFVETMSQPVRDYRESLQASRDGRYEEMIEESETMDVPTIGSRRR